MIPPKTSICYRIGVPRFQITVSSRTESYRIFKIFIRKSSQRPRYRNRQGGRGLGFNPTANFCYTYIYKKKEKQKNWPTQAHCATMGKSTVSTLANLHCATMGAVNCCRNGTHIGTYVCSGTYLYVIGTEQIFRKPTYILWIRSSMTLANL